jgi:hypothetical protein
VGTESILVIPIATPSLLHAIASPANFVPSQASSHAPPAVRSGIHLRRPMLKSDVGQHPTATLP